MPAFKLLDANPIDLGPQRLTRERRTGQAESPGDTVDFGNQFGFERHLDGSHAFPQC